MALSTLTFISTCRPQWAIIERTGGDVVVKSALRDAALSAPVIILTGWRQPRHLVLASGLTLCLSALMSSSLLGVLGVLSALWTLRRFTITISQASPQISVRLSVVGLHKTYKVPLLNAQIISSPRATPHLDRVERSSRWRALRSVLSSGPRDSTQNTQHAPHIQYKPRSALLSAGLDELCLTHTRVRETLPIATLTRAESQQLKRLLSLVIIEKRRAQIGERSLISLDDEPHTRRRSWVNEPPEWVKRLRERALPSASLQREISPIRTRLSWRRVTAPSTIIVVAPLCALMLWTAPLFGVALTLFIVGAQLTSRCVITLEAHELELRESMCGAPLRVVTLAYPITVELNADLEHPRGSSVTVWGVNADRGHRCGHHTQAEMIYNALCGALQERGALQR